MSEYPNSCIGMRTDEVLISAWASSKQLPDSRHQRSQGVRARGPTKSFEVM